MAVTTPSRARAVVASAAAGVTTILVLALAYATTHDREPLASIDESVANHLHTWVVDTPGAVGFLEAVSLILHPNVLRALAAVLAVVLWRRGRRREAVWVVVTMVAALLVGVVIKVTVQRARPSFADPVSSAHGYSFPSGHALTSAVFFAILTLLLVRGRSRIRTLCVASVASALVLLVGFARVALGVHWLSDVVTAWLIAAGLLVVTIAACDPWRDERT